MAERLAPFAPSNVAAVPAASGTVVFAPSVPRITAEVVNNGVATL